MSKGGCDRKAKTEGYWDEGSTKIKRRGQTGGLVCCDVDVNSFLPTHLIDDVPQIIFLRREGGTVGFHRKEVKRSMGSCLRTRSRRPSACRKVGETLTLVDLVVSLFAGRLWKLLFSI